MSDHLQRIAQLNDELKQKLLRYMETPCIYPTAIEGFNLVRREDAGMSEKCFEKPLVGLVIQGTKHSLMGGQEYVYTENQSVVAGVDMPISSYVINPTHEKPFLFLYLYLDKQLLSSLALDMKQSFTEDMETNTSISVADTDTDILEMFLRLLELHEKRGFYAHKGACRFPASPEYGETGRGPSGILPTGSRFAGSPSRCPGKGAIRGSGTVPRA